MPKTDIKIYASDGNTGNKTTATISYVNPEASNSVLKTMAQKLNALTTNTYISTDRVETIEVDTDTSRKSFRNLQFSNIVAGQTATLTFQKDSDETIDPLVFCYSNGTLTEISVTSSSTSTATEAVFTFQVPSSGSVRTGIAAQNGFYADYIKASISS